MVSDLWNPEPGEVTASGYKCALITGPAWRLETDKAAPAGEQAPASRLS